MRAIQRVVSPRHGRTRSFNFAGAFELHAERMVRRFTGGGSGRTFIFLGHKAGATVEVVAEEYFCAAGHRAHLLTGSSLDAHEFGTLRLRASS